MAGIKGRSGGHNRKSVERHFRDGTFNVTRHRQLLAPAVPAWQRTAEPPPPAPAGLRVRSRRLWDAIVREHDTTSTDCRLLEEGLRAIDRADQARARIRREGVMQDGPRGSRYPHPLLRVEARSSQLAAAIFRQLGLDGDR